jgi:F-type H+-transporting ATPase subunit alpha
LELDAISIGGRIKNKIEEYQTRFNIQNIGTVVQSGDGIVRIEGLHGCKYGELLVFNEDVYGIAMNLEESHIGAVLLNNEYSVSEGTVASSTGRIVQVPVGDALLGRAVNPLGHPMDGKGTIHTDTYRPIEESAPSILDRQGVHDPLQTGLMAIDSMIPIGKGQRELIIGDRQTGKTAIALDTILNQRGKNVICIYVAIGQKASTISQVINTMREMGAIDYCIVVASTASDSAPMQYIAPYAGCTMAEHFMYEGRDVLIVYDDLSKHAVAYRAMSLLLRRPPGREAYPGDVFYLHSRLLERAAKLSDEKGGGSMTALPIIETQAGDISGYIPTNVISITDGQLFLESELFFAGIRPAVNTGLSVSRVGSAAQIPAMKKVTGSLRLELAQYRELEVFSQFGSELDATTLEFLAQGQRITEVLKQDQYHPMDVTHQVIMLYVVSKKMLLDIELADIQMFKRELIEYMENHFKTLLQRIRDTNDITDDDKEEIDGAVNEFKRMFKKANPQQVKPAQPGKPGETTAAAGTEPAGEEAEGENKGEEAGKPEEKGTEETEKPEKTGTPAEKENAQPEEKPEAPPEDENKPGDVS